MRGHGPDGHYHGRYSSAELDAWAAWIKARRKAGVEVFSYFDNDVKSAAPKDARLLIDRLKP